MGARGLSVRTRVRSMQTEYQCSELLQAEEYNVRSKQEDTSKDRRRKEKVKQREQTDGAKVKEK